MLAEKDFPLDFHLFYEEDETEELPLESTELSGEEEDEDEDDSNEWSQEN